MKSYDEIAYVKEFASYAALNVIGMIGLSCYILADTFFVSKGLGTNGLAALNLAIPVYNLINGVGMMLAVGGATRFSIFKSRNKQSGCDPFTNTVFTAAVFSLVFITAGIFFSSPLTSLLGGGSVEQSAFEMAHTYIRMMLLFSPAYIFNNILIRFIQNDGSPSVGMTAMLAGSAANIILDYVFIFPLGLGMLGAVLATVFAPITGISISMIYILKGKNSFKFKPRRLHRNDLSLQLGCLSLGFPLFVSEISSGIVILVFNIITLRLMGNIGVAAYGVVANISLVVISIFTGVAQGSQPILSSAYGANNTQKLRTVFRCAVISVISISAVIYATVFTAAEPLTAIFNSENNLKLQQTAVWGMKLYFTGILFAGFNILSAMYFTSVEKPLPAQIISLLRGLFLIVPAAFLLSSIFGITGMWLAFPTAEFIVAIAAVFILNQNTHN